MVLLGLGVLFWYRRRRNAKGSDHAIFEPEWGPANGENHLMSEQLASHPFDPYMTASYSQSHVPFLHSAATETTTDVAEQVLPHSRTQSVVQPAPRTGKAALNMVSDPSDHSRSRHDSSANPPSSAGDDSVQLRSEVENLRQQMEEMRARSNYEPPPQYR